MAKKQLYFDQAERMFVVEQMTLSEIALQLGVAESTLRNWKAEGNWDKKRKQYLQSRQAFHEELYEFSRFLMQSIRSDLESGEKVDPGRMYAFTRMLPLITKIKDYEDIVNQSAKEEDSGKKGITEDLINIIERDILGIKK